MPSGQSPGSNSIIVGNCIVCEGLLRVSAKAKSNAQVRCPHCQETFSLASLLESAVPEVEMLQPDASAASSVASPTVTATTTTDTPEKKDLYIDKGVDTSKDAAGKFVVPSQLAKGARRRKSSRSRSSSRSGSSSRSSRDGHRSGSSDHRSDEGRGASDGSRSEGSRSESDARGSNEFADDSSRSPEGASHRSTRHRDKRATQAAASEPNPFVTFLKILAGAGIALPIAYLIVMWGFTRDPLGIGKQIGERMPFVVPAAFRAVSDDDSDSSDTAGEEFDASQFESDSASPFEGLNIGAEALQGLDR